MVNFNDYRELWRYSDEPIALRIFTALLDDQHEFVFSGVIASISVFIASYYLFETLYQFELNRSRLFVFFLIYGLAILIFSFFLSIITGPGDFGYAWTFIIVLLVLPTQLLPWLTFCICLLFDTWIQTFLVSQSEKT